MTEPLDAGDSKLEVPRADPLDELRAAGFNATLQLIPVAGSIAAEFVTSGLTIKARARDEQFFQQVADKLHRLEATVAGFTLQSAMDDEVFNANAHKVVRAARETTSEEKRRRLANALVNSGAWSELGVEESQTFLDLLVRFGERHLVALAFLADPRGWIGKEWPEAMQEGARLSPEISLYTVLLSRVFEPSSRRYVDVALAELRNEGLLGGLGENAMDHSVPHPKSLESVVSQRGRRFLKFIRDPL